MHRLVNAIKPYAWGSKTEIAKLCGRAASTEPEAELWMGAHPLGPSKLQDGGESLADYIHREPAALGARVRAAFGDRLPFLFKVLAAAEPLSLQAHPSEAQAREGFAREEAAKIPLDAPHRNYKDAHHKPELICAVTPFHALCGFRAIEDTRALVRALGSEALGKTCRSLLDAQSTSDAALRDAFTTLLALPPSDASALVTDVIEKCKLHASGGPFAEEFRWAVRLSEMYPGDVGAVVSLLLNLVTLAPGDAIYLPAGNLHAYLEGTGLEIMAASDNVLRGGMTKKHVDVPELSRVLDFRAGPVDVSHGRQRGAHERVYETDAPEFELSRVDVPRATPANAFTPSGPEIWLAVSGAIDFVRSRGREPLTLHQGESIFVEADEGTFTLAGEGALFRAAVPRR